MRKKPEIPKLNVVTFKYNGDQKTFEKFLANMAADYFNSDILPEYMLYNFSDMVEFPSESAIPLDK